MKPQPLDRYPNEDESDSLSGIALRDWIVALFSEKLHLEVPSVETDLMETGVLDSLTLVDLLLHLEQGLGIKISLEELDLDNFRSIAGIADFIGRTRGAARRNGFRNPA